MKNPIQNNIKIAQFVGMFYVENSKCLRDKRQKPYTVHRETELKYHYDWNWLMEVVEKIENLDFVFNMTGKTNYTAIVNDKNVFVSDKSTKIENVYNSVLAFIDWYNSKTKADANEEE